MDERKTTGGKDRGGVPDWAGLVPAGIVALGAPTQPVERLIGVQAGVYRLMVALGRLRLPRALPGRAARVRAVLE
jgi:hypothetical protein